MVKIVKRLSPASPKLSESPTSPNSIRVVRHVRSPIPASNTPPLRTESPIEVKKPTMLIVKRPTPEPVIPKLVVPELVVSEPIIPKIVVSETTIHYNINSAEFVHKDSFEEKVEKRCGHYEDDRDDVEYLLSAIHAVINEEQ